MMIRCFTSAWSTNCSSSPGAPRSKSVSGKCLIMFQLVALLGAASVFRVHREAIQLLTLQLACDWHGVGTDDPTLKALQARCARLVALSDPKRLRVALVPRDLTTSGRIAVFPRLGAGGETGNDGKPLFLVLQGAAAGRNSCVPAQCISTSQKDSRAKDSADSPVEGGLPTGWCHRLATALHCDSFMR